MPGSAQALVSARGGGRGLFFLYDRVAAILFFWFLAVLFVVLPGYILFLVMRWTWISRDERNLEEYAGFDHERGVPSFRGRGVRGPCMMGIDFPADSGLFCRGTILWA